MAIESCSIGGERVAVRLAGRMEESLQAFAVRAACFIGEMEVPFSEEFDGHDYGATHVIAYIGDEPIGTVRVRWFKSFAMTERLAVMQRFRGHNVGQLLLERCRQLAESRGCNMLYTRLPPDQAAYFEKQGWRRLDETSERNHRPIVALVHPVDPAKAGVAVDAQDAQQYRGALPVAA